MTVYMARFTDGSISEIKLRGQYGHSSLIGVAERGDGYKRVLFFDATIGVVTGPFDPWVSKIFSSQRS